MYSIYGYWQVRTRLRRDLKWNDQVISSETIEVCWRGPGAVYCTVDAVLHVVHAGA